MHNGVSPDMQSTRNENVADRTDVDGTSNEGVSHKTDI